MENSQNFKDKILTLVLVVVLGIFLTLGFFVGKNYQKKLSDPAEQYLKEQLEKAQKEAEQWKQKSDSTYLVGTSLMLKIDSLEKRIEEIKKTHGQKVTIIKSYTNPELERFFTERYGSL